MKQHPPGLPADPRERLLIAAEELFAVNGFDGTTVREICDRAGMNIAAVNYHFRDKQTLYVAVVRNAHAATAGPGGAFVPVPPADVPAVDRLRWLIRGMATHMVGPVRPCAVQVLMRELGTPSDAARSVVDDLIRPTADALFAILSELMPDADPHVRLMVGYSVVGQCLYYRQNRACSIMLHGVEAVDALTPNLVARHVTRFTLAALGLADPYPTVTGSKP